MSRDPALPLDDTRHEAFSKLRSRGVLPAAAYAEAVSNRFSKKSTTSHASNLQSRSEVAARIAWLTDNAETDPSAPLDDADHEVFAQAIAAGVSRLDAYRKAFDDDLADRSALNRASLLSGHPVVLARIQWLENQRPQRTGEDPLPNLQEDSFCQLFARRGNARKSFVEVFGVDDRAAFDRLRNRPTVKRRIEWLRCQPEYIEARAVAEAEQEAEREAEREKKAARVEAERAKARAEREAAQAARARAEADREIARAAKAAQVKAERNAAKAEKAARVKAEREKAKAEREQAKAARAAAKVEREAAKAARAAQAKAAREAAKAARAAAPKPVQTRNSVQKPVRIRRGGRIDPAVPLADANHERFAKLLQADGNATACYISVFGGDAANAAVRKAASKLQNRPEVKSRVEWLRLAARMDTSDVQFDRAALTDLFREITEAIKVALHSLIEANGRPSTITALRTELINHLARLKKLDPPQTDDKRETVVEKLAARAAWCDCEAANA